MAPGKLLIDVTTRVLRATDKEKVIKVLANSFLTEPMLSHTGEKFEVLDNFVRSQWKNVETDDLTILAESKHDTILGCSMALDFATKPPPELLEIASKSEHMKAMSGLFEHADQYYVKLQGFTMADFPPNHTVHMYMLATEPQFRNQGIASKLRRAGLEHYKAKGYRYAMSQATSLFTRRVCINFGFETVLQVPYKDWYPTGSVYTKQTADGHDAMHLIVKEL